MYIIGAVSTTHESIPDDDIVMQLADLVHDDTDPATTFTLGAASGEILRLRHNAADLIERLEKAESALFADAASNRERDERIRLRAKATGVSLALSYAREYQR